jgi:hypothetical protein
MGRSRPFWSRSVSLTTTPAVVYLPNGYGEVKVAVDARSYGQLGASYTPPAVGATNGITTISSGGTPTAGTFLIRVFPSQGADFAAVFTTSALTYDESAADVKTALISGSTMFVTGDITAAGGALPVDITLTWTGVYAATVPPIEIVSSVTGGTIYQRTTTVPDGNGNYVYIAANTQERWTADSYDNRNDRFLYIATVAGTGTADVSCYY